MKNTHFAVGVLGLIFGAASLVFVAGVSAQTAPLKVENPELVAEVNGDKITRRQLNEECLQIHGANELQELINKTLIKTECAKNNIRITAAEIDAEIVHIAKTVGLSSEEFLRSLEEYRNVDVHDYRQNTLWKILALRKLAGPRLNISEQEINDTYESQFGPAVKVRQLVLASRADAEKALQELRANPDNFTNVVKNRSVDQTSQPYGGLIQPIRRNSINPNVEKIVFAMNPGDISEVIEWPAGQFLIFKCEQHLPAENVDRQAVREQIIMKLQEYKLRSVAEDVFRSIRNSAKIQIVFGNMVLMGQQPGVAAVVNGKMISQNDLAGVCTQKYGKEILNEMISRLVVEQACRRAKMTITDADINNEIREMAIKHLPLKEDGSPDIENWLKRSMENSGQPVSVYRKNTIVPVLSLKKLTRKDVIVTEEDVQRSFEANFGRKVRCLAILFSADDHRRAQEVWDMANKQRTAENFGDLAEKYSVDPDTRLARGVIPAIGKYCGSPLLEKEAFSLKPNELSQIVQVDENLVILYCLDFVEPMVTKLDDVKADLIADIFEKKQSYMVGKYYQNLYDQAAIDNYLTGESRNPRIEEAMSKEQPKTK